MSDTAAIVVTYNRKKLLKECIRNLQKQTQQVDIIVIDNMSTDGTVDMLKPLIKNNSIIYHSTGKNIGGAGGFYEGIKLAYKLGYEYFWLMDDDCIPQSNSLRQLKIADKRLNGKYGFICSKVLWTNGDICLMNIPKLSLFKKVSDFHTSIVSVKMGTFVSFLTKRSVVEKVGLPIKEFFIWGDDVEYSQRISNNYPCYLINDSTVIHKTKNNEGSNIALDDYERINRYKLAYRNEVVLYRKMGIKGYLYQFTRLNLHAIRIIVKSKNHKLLRLKTLISGTKNGIAFHPQIKKVRE
ncbi:MAG: glycosyltransferase family 2 protein [Lactobacillus johnsonii]|nr:glycosyltransferase family 2 protein [Lactobacillus johnsonii]MDY4728897.1 glycosyltransferase family 2 protein [Lactobacillus amylovorus]